MRRPTIRLLLSDGTFCQYITPREASDLEARGRAVRQKRGSKKKKNTARGMPSWITYKLLPEPVALRSMHEASPPSITSSDMLANVGITPGLGEADPAVIRRAQKKIRLFEPIRNLPAEAT